MRTKLFLIGLLLLGMTRLSMAQTITNYAFTTSNGSFSAITGGATTTWTGNTDDAVSALIPIGFDFYYMGTRYTSIGATTNGWISLGGVATTYQYINNLASSGSPRPVIAPLWDDLDIASYGNVTYLTSGTAGSRVFTLQFLNVKWNYQALGSVCSFQIKLHEGTGKIEFIYRSDAVSANSPSASIGITAAGTGSGNFLSVSNNGNNVSSTSESNITSKRATGRTYAFASPVPTAPNDLTFSDVGSTGMTLNWTDASSNETGFAIYRSTDNVNFTYVTKTAANATSSAQTGLSDGTTYYWRVYAVTEGALSADLSGTQATNCTPPAAPDVTSTITYCQGATATALTASGSNLVWSMGGTASGVAGGTAALTTSTYVDDTYNNRKTNFTTNFNNVTITSVDYYLPAWQSVNALVIGLFNSTGTLLATSSTITTQTAGASAVAITNTFNYTLTTAGSYSIGVVSGYGIIGADNPSFPITESSNTVSVTGVSYAGSRCYNNIKFSGTSSTAPVPSTTAVGSTDYLVTQTVNGCTSAPATITVIVTAPNISQVPANGLIARYLMSGNAQDAANNNAGTLQNAPASTADRFGNANKALSFNGSSQYISTANAYNNPTEFTISIWFKTNTATGGKLIGFGREQTGTSGQYDRHIYMTNTGQLYFGIYNGTVQTVSSVASFNDNNWHQVTATLSPTTGMALYVDGVQAGVNATATSPENYTGYWRTGYDNMNGWTAQPTNHYFTGVLDDALIYHRALSAAEVNTVYVSPDGAGNNGPACVGTPITLSGVTLSGASYAWSGPGGFSSALQNPSFNYDASKAGTYTLQVTLNGCVATAYTNVSAGTNSGQWTGNASTDWADANNWCTGVVPDATTNVVIASTATRMPVINGVAACNNLTINSGASLTVTGAGTLNIAGVLANSGTVTNNGTTVFMGSAGQQTFSGVPSFHNLTINNTNGVLLPAAITINNNLLITAGKLNSGNFNITVKGNWTNNAASDAFQAGSGTVTFNGKTAQTIGGSFVTAFNNLIVADTSNTVALGNHVQVAGNLSVTTGTFDLGVYTANRISAGGELMVANNATLRIGGTNSFPVNFSTTTLVVASTVEYAGTNQDVANRLYGNLVLSSITAGAVRSFPASALNVVGNLISTAGAGASLTFTPGAPVTVNGNVNIGASTVFNGSSFMHTIAGNWANNGTFNGNSSTVTFSGAGATVGGSGAQNFHHLTVAGSLINFTNGSVTLSGNLITSGAGSFSQASGGTLTMTGAGTSIAGNGISPDNLVISGSVTTAATINITGHLTVNGSLAATGGIITMSGSGKTISGTGSKLFNTFSATGSISTGVDLSIGAGLIVNGSFLSTGGTATFSGSSTLSGIANLYNATINGTSLRLSANATLGISGALSVTAGVLDVASSMPNTVNFNGNNNQVINAITYCHLVTSGSGAKTAAGNTTVLHDIIIGNGTSLDAGSYTHSVFGSWYNNGQFIAGASAVEFLGPATAYIKGATTFHILTSNTSVASTDLILQSSVTASTVNMVKGIIRTGTDTLTITNTRTGDGIIWGNIRRTHAFTTGVDYAFRSPQNTVHFTAVSAVGSMVVTVIEKQIADFPFGGSVNLEYNIHVPAGSYTAALRLDYEDNELNGHNEASMTLWRNPSSSWTLVGKTGNSTTLNYVEQDGLTAIDGRWTFSDQVNHVRWNGSVSTDWHTAANWTAIDGSPSMPPSALDVVDLGTAVFDHQPVISGNAVAKNIYFGSAQVVSLSLAGGGALTVSGNIEGLWSANATHTIQVNNQTMTVQGNLDLSDGIAGHSIDLQIGAGTVNVQESLHQSGDASISFSGAGILNVQDDFEYDGGAFTAGTGTVLYSGSGNQRIAQVDYYNLTIDKSSGIGTIDSVVHVGNDLNIAAGQLDANKALYVAGDVHIGSGATLQNTDMLYVGGNWNRTGSYTSNSASVYFNGSGTQNISATTFNNLFIDKPVGSVANLTGNLVINGDITVNSGTINLHTFTCNRSVEGGKATLAAAGTIIIGGNNPPDLFTIYDLSPASTVIYDGADPQFIAAPGIGFGNLIFRNAGYKSLITPLIVNGDLTIEYGTVFNADSNTISLNGNWIDSGDFEPATSTVLFTGNTKTIAGNTSFYKATIIGSYTILNNVTFNDLLHVTNTGSISGGSSVQVMMHGDLINSGVLYSLGTTTYSGTRVQTLRLVDAITTVALIVNFNGSVSPVLNSTTAPQFGYLNINNTGGVNPSVGWTVLYTLTVGPGASFNGGSSTHNIMGSMTNHGTITSSGLLNFAPSTAVTLNLGTQLYSTGRVLFGGTGAITLAGEPDSLTDVTISNTNVAGITPVTGWNMARNLTIDAGAIFHAGNYTYRIGGNLANNGTLDYGTSTFVFNGDGQQDINTPVNFHHAKVDKATGVVLLHGNVSVNGDLEFLRGNIATSQYIVGIGAAATVSGAAQNSGWVYGKLQKHIAAGATVRLFEVGDSASYTPVQVSFDNVSTPGNLTAYTTMADHPQISSSTINAARSVNRFWSLINNGIVFNNYKATFYFLESDVDPGTATNKLVAGRYSDGGWIYPTIGAVTLTSVEALGLTAFVDFQLGEMILLVKSWDGGAGTRNWSDAANWNTDGVPSINDEVELNRADTIDVDIAAVAKKLLINNTGLVLSIKAGQSLTLSQDLNLLAGTLNTAAAFPATGGAVHISGGTVGFTGNGAQTIPAHAYYNLVSSGAGSRTLASIDTIHIAGSFIPGSNSYVNTGSVIAYDGDGPQVIAPFAYQHLVLASNGEKTFAADTTRIAGVMSILDNASAHATMNASTISFNGNSTQQVNPITYYNLDVASQGGPVVLPDVAINNNLSVRSGVLAIGEDATARTLHVNGNVSVAAGATLQVATTSNTTHTLNLRGDIVNEGTLDLHPDANSACDVVFMKDDIQSIMGNGAMSRFNAIKLNMGNSGSNYLEVSASHFMAPDGFLTLQNGSFLLNSSGVTIKPFMTDVAASPYLVPGTAGLWVNAGTIESGNMNWSIAGHIRVSGGVLNMGSVADNAVIPQSSALIEVNGGSLNLASRIGNPGSSWSLLMKGGTLTVNTQGSTAADIAPFAMDVAGCSFDVAGGAIVIQQAGGGTGQLLGYKNISMSGSGFEGGTLQIGNAATPVNQLMEVVSLRPLYNLSVNSAYATAFLQSTNLSVTNNVVVESGTLDIKDLRLKIGGGIVSNGNFIASAGTIELDGAATQVIPANAFTGNLVQNLTINNEEGAALAGELNLTAILLAAQGTFNTGGHLTLVSTATQTALIDGAGAGEVMGDVTMQRYHATGFGYKYYSSPFQAATVNEFADDINLGASFPTLYRFDENLTSNGWVRYINTADPLRVGEGYAAQLGPSSAPKTVDLTGVVNNGTVAFPLLYNHNMTYTQGFNLVGNPYPSPIDWDAANGWTRNNIDNAVYYFNAGATNQYTGTYSSYINGISSDGTAGNVIAAMQGFFVHVSDGTYPVAASLGVNNNARVNNLVPDFRRRSPLTLPLLRLNAAFADEQKPADHLVVYFDNADASKGFDKEMDALKLMNTDSLVPNLYVVAPGKAKLSICAWTGLEDSSDIIPLGLETKRSGWVSFNMTSIERVPIGKRVYLYDSKTGIYQDMKVNPKYRVFIETGEVHNRFFLVFSKRDQTVSEPVSVPGTYAAYAAGSKLYVKVADAPADKIQVMVTNMMGQVLLRKQVAGNGVHDLGTGLTNGVYVVTVYTGNRLVFSKKIAFGL